MGKIKSEETKGKVLGYIKFQAPYIISLIGVSSLLFTMHNALRIAILWLCVLSIFIIGKIGKKES